MTTKHTSNADLFCAAFRARRKAALLSVASEVLADAVEAAREAGADASELVAAYAALYGEAERAERFADSLDSAAEQAAAAEDLATVADAGSRGALAAIFGEEAAA